SLVNSGFSLTADPGDADVIIINTCGFIESAREESIDTILEACELKRSNLCKKLIVVGCFPQRYKSKLSAELPEVDAFFGVNEIENILRFLGDSKLEPADPDSLRMLLTPGHYAFLKISSGCDNLCSFCSIPLIRGKQISKSPEAVLKEAEILAGKGVKELIIIAQDTTAYGRDLPCRATIVDLLDSLCRIDGIEWIRLMYTNPDHFPPRLINLLSSQSRICPYIDLPVQHISDRILKSMRRELMSEGIKRLIHDLREKVPSIAIRTSLMVGFPGETEKDFLQLMDFVEETKFERLGVFTYSEEEGTPAVSLKKRVPEEIKYERADAIMILQQQISVERNLSLLNKKLKVIVDDFNGDTGKYTGRTVWDAPEIDNRVIIEGDVKIGNFYEVTVKDADAYELKARYPD
ncbi:MAG: 30S ribosomal protein S12 methylthiotransferase RimO, partial [Fidelibacterota bacterium]